MKIFISQKMRGKSKEEIEKERTVIKEKVVAEKLLDGTYVHEYETLSFIESYKPELAFKDPITSLAQSLAMLAEADIVLVPIIAEQNIRGFIHENITQCDEGDYEPWLETIDKLNFDDIRVCEFEFLIAKSYGKKVYTYDDQFNFEEV